MYWLFYVVNYDELVFYVKLDILEPELYELLSLWKLGILRPEPTDLLSF